MPNLTITTDEETLRWARIEAAKRGTSVSKLVGEILANLRKQDDDYEQAMQDFFSRKPYLDPPPRTDGRRWPSREEIYDRPVLKKKWG
ncbi:MAG: hypothetical protein HXY29_02110 [Rhodocyclaceae bacterium]|jgi:hypothetical protein|nr:hypothetical protein [Rhodocyclaceae bacterium]